MNHRKAKKRARPPRRDTPAARPAEQPAAQTAEQTAGPPAEPSAEPSADELIKQLAGQLADREAQVERLQDAVRAHESYVGRLLRGFGGVVDSFDRLLELGPDVGLDAHRASVGRTHAALTTMLRKNEVELIGEPGEIAEPETHEVLHPEPAPDLPEDTVLTVVQRGIRHRGTLIRPAAVVVASGEPAKDDQAPDDQAPDDNKAPDGPHDNETPYEPYEPYDNETPDNSQAPNDNETPAEVPDTRTAEPVPARSGGTGGTGGKEERQ
ncbi:nucleotide exchange factor GrpE [Streptomyces sp. NPDC127033]|uniref:nucleotide exchange factor GrpE n=1 Tax=Streptomyces sp. NPDC127033 TaxID=3347110 RepID=UPI003659900C